jgi:hypothetical protein
VPAYAHCNDHEGEAVHGDLGRHPRASQRAQLPDRRGACRRRRRHRAGRPQADDDRTRLIDYYDLGQATYAMALAAADLGIGTGHSSVGEVIHHGRW